MNRTIRPVLLAIVVLLSSPALPAFAQSEAKAVVKPVAELKWTDGGVPGVASAAVSGDMAKGASHFYLKYAAGFAAPLHHHSADHYVSVLSGNLILIVDGKEHRLAPGSYFELTGKAKHGARCDGTQDCVMFIDARSPWDVVVANSNAGK